LTHINYHDIINSPNKYKNKLKGVEQLILIYNLWNIYSTGST